VDAEPASLSFGLSEVKFGDHCWAKQEYIVKQGISEPIVEQQ
jgi:hypothetical protein